MDLDPRLDHRPGELVTRARAGKTMSSSCPAHPCQSLRHIPVARNADHHPVGRDGGPGHLPNLGPGPDGIDDDGAHRPILSDQTTPVRPARAVGRVAAPYAPAMGEEMAYAHLGRSGLLVSRIGLGTMNFGNTDWTSRQRREGDAASTRASTAATPRDGYAARRRRRWWATAAEDVGPLAPQRAPRPRLATKVYQPMGLGPNDRRLSAYHIRRAGSEASLRRLQTDHIDLYQMHHVDRATPWEGDLAGDGATGPGGEGQLRRQQATSPPGTWPSPSPPPRPGTSWA